MSFVFVFGVGSADVLHVSAAAIAGGQRMTFAVACGLMLVALDLFGTAAPERPSYGIERSMLGWAGLIGSLGPAASPTDVSGECR